MKRCYQIKLFDMAQSFSMIVIDGDEDAEHVARCIFGDERVEWVI